MISAGAGRKGRGDVMLHFAYGSNMSRAPMRARCPSAREVGTATLAGYRLIVTSQTFRQSSTAAPGG